MFSLIFHKEKSSQVHMSTWSYLFVVLLPGNHSVTLTLAGCKAQCINAEKINANSLSFKKVFRSLYKHGKTL